MEKLIEIRDALLVEADTAAADLVTIPRHIRYSHRMYLAAIVEAWRILDREVARLAEEE